MRNSRRARKSVVVRSDFSSLLTNSLMIKDCIMRVRDARTARKTEPFIRDILLVVATVHVLFVDVHDGERNRI